MTTIAPIPAPAALRPGLAKLNVNTGADRFAIGPIEKASTIVKLSAAGRSAAQAGTVQAAPTLKSLVASNAAADSLGARLRGLGAALLGQSGAGASVSESVQLPPPGHTGTPYGPVEVAGAPALHGAGDDRITLGVTTARGVKVNIALDSSAGALAVQMGSSADLNEDEQAALAGMADAFESALDGLAQRPPQLDLAALGQIDPSVLASVDLHANVRQDTDPANTYAISFHADAAQRTIDVSGPAGKLALSVDTTQPGSVGSDAQRARAMASYLKQFDQAAARGHADPALIGMFKAAFAGLHSTAAAAPAAGGFAQAGKISVSAQDQGALSGLADFAASLTQTAGAPNPMRPAELDGFDYHVAQSTSIGGRSDAERTISQQQSSSLKASYHTPAVPGMPLKLDQTLESQNYSYHEINDAASSTVDVAYREGRLIKAGLRQESSQSARVLQYVLGKVVADTLTPARQSLQRDLLATLAPYQSGDGTRTDLQRSDLRVQTMAGLGEAVLLQAYPQSTDTP